MHLLEGTRFLCKSELLLPPCMTRLFTTVNIRESMFIII